MPDAIIIGAGPAGSLAAILLARGGWSVTLVEQHRFPRDKVCGECLSALGMEVIERGELGAQFHELRPVRLTGAAIHTQLGESLRLKLPRPMWGVSRQHFDSCLLDATRSAEVKLLQPARCESIESTPQGPVARIRDLSTNRVETRSADWMVLADGKAALMPGSRQRDHLWEGEGPAEPRFSAIKRLGRSPALPGWEMRSAHGLPSPTGNFGIKAHFENIDGPRDSIELFGCAGLYGGLAAIENGCWNAAFSVPGERIRKCRGDLDQLFGEIAAENRTLGHRVARAKRVGRWLAAPLPRFAVQRAWPDRVIPVGNAAAALEPIGGEGMGLALRSAEIAATTLLRGGEDGIRNIRDCFRHLWATRRWSCRTAALAVTRDGPSRILPLFGASPALGRLALELIGK